MLASKLVQVSFKRQRHRSQTMIRSLDSYVCQDDNSLGILFQEDSWKHFGLVDDERLLIVCSQLPAQKEIPILESISRDLGNRVHDQPSTGPFAWHSSYAIRTLQNKNLARYSIISQTAGIERLARSKSPLEETPCALECERMTFSSPFLYFALIRRKSK